MPSEIEISTTIQNKLEATRRNLLDLGRRNSLLNYHTSNARGVEVVDELPKEIFRILVREKKAMAFLPDLNKDNKISKNAKSEQPPLFGFPSNGTNGNSNQILDKKQINLSISQGESGLPKRHIDLKLQTALDSDTLQKRLLKMSYLARASIEEQGVNILYLALGLLQWYDAESSPQPLNAPLILIPLELVRADVRERFQIRFVEAELGHNLSLEEKLKAEFGINLPHFHDTETFDVNDYFNRVQQIVSNQPRWRVNTQAINVGFFSFGKFLLYKDLDSSNWPQDMCPADNPIIKGLFLGNLPQSPSPVVEGQSLDHQIVIQKLQPVLDADSSQAIALADALQGSNLVIHGPPGTGKSQTITNLIAEAVANGKTVLFVAEKLAALEVVKHRMDEIGLGDTCLELHSHSSNKKTVLANLAKSIQPAFNDTEFNNHELNTLQESRDRLNAYCEAVNTPIKESDLTPYDIMGELLELDYQNQGITIPIMKIMGVRDWSQSNYSKLSSLVKELEVLFQLIGSPLQHPFGGSSKQSFNVAEREELLSAINNSISAIDKFSESSKIVSQPVGLNVPQRLKEFPITDFFLEIPSLYGLNLKAPEWLSQAEAINTLLTHGQILSELHRQYDPILKPESWNTPDLLLTRQTLNKIGRKWWRKWSGKYKSAITKLSSLLVVPLSPDLTAQLAILDAILTAQQMQNTWVQLQGLANYLFKNYWKGLSSDWPLLFNMTQKVQYLQNQINAKAVSVAFLPFLENTADISFYKSALSEVRNSKTLLEENIRSVLKLLQLNPQHPLNSPEKFIQQDITTQLETLSNWKTHLPELQEIASLNVLTLRCKEAGLEAYTSAANNWPDAGKYLVKTFRRNWLISLLDLAQKERPAINYFNRITHEQIIAQFRELDSQILKYNRKEILRSYSKRINKLFQSYYSNSPGSSQKSEALNQYRLLKRETEKKSRHIPLRKLLQNASSLIQTLKPVFMMSPLSVATYLTPTGPKFDLVVFDEASQIRPADAFSAILRGSQVVVAGDDKQLPPSSFFETTTESTSSDSDDDLDDNTLDATDSGDFESILTLFRAVGSPRMLRWHYRSRHESLIAVSNSEFYENKLIIFPSPDGGREELGLIYHYLPDTVYDRGNSRTNVKEALKVAEAVMNHAKTRPNLSLGVATFSQAQRQAVSEQLELLRRKDPSAEPFFTSNPNEPFFIKNLENVQGDERDVIYISIGYGRDADGKVLMTFGPLTATGGERRLNVLITRARRRCEVFTNLTPDDINLNSSASKGLSSLKTFLEYARTGKLISSPVASNREPDSPFEEAVMHSISSKGYKVVPQVGQAGFFIDLAIVDPDQPGRYLLGIECDGATYHSALSARDRDRLRQQILENLGWKIHRIWSTDWFANQERELNRLVQAIESALASRPVKPKVKPVLSNKPPVAKTSNKPVTTSEAILPSNFVSAPLKVSIPDSQNAKNDYYPLRTCEWCSNSVYLVNNRNYFDLTPFQPHQCERNTAY